MIQGTWMLKEGPYCSRAIASLFQSTNKKSTVTKFDDICCTLIGSSHKVFMIVKKYQKQWSVARSCRFKCQAELLVMRAKNVWFTTLLKYTFFFFYQPNLPTYFCIHVFCLTLPQMARLWFIFSLTPMPWPGIELTSAQRHLFWGTLTQAAWQA